MLKFKHRPKLGDTIYSLPVIKELGGGVLYLDPRIHGQPSTPSFQGYNKNDLEWIELFELLIPIILQQDYITGCEIYDGELPVDYDLDFYFYCGHMRGIRGYTIVDAHYDGAKMFARMSQKKEPVFNRTKPQQPWLKAKHNSLKNECKKIVFANTGSWGPSPSQEVSLNFLKEIEKDLMYNCNHYEQLKVGTPRKPGNLLEWFEIIDGCDLFIGNQSFPLSLAVGLGKKRMIIECGSYPNCTFEDDKEYVIGRHEDNMSALKKFLS